MDVAAWLHGIDLERYEQAFRENEIDWDALPKLTAEDLNPHSPDETVNSSALAAI